MLSDTAVAVEQCQMRREIQTRPKSYEAHCRTKRSIKHLQSDNTVISPQDQRVVSIATGKAFHTIEHDGEWIRPNFCRRGPRFESKRFQRMPCVVFDEIL